MKGIKPYDVADQTPGGWSIIDNSDVQPMVHDGRKGWGLGAVRAIDQHEVFELVHLRDLRREDCVFEREEVKHATEDTLCAAYGEAVYVSCSMTCW